MPAVAPDLRPRGPAELYDAAVHLCMRGRTALPALALAGAVFPAISGLALEQRVLAGKPRLLDAAVFALCLMVRGFFAGAASVAGEASLEGTPISSWAAVRRACARGPSLLSAGGMLVIVEWFCLPASCFLGLLAWSPLYAGLAVVARGDAGPWSMGRVCRRHLSAAPTFAVRLLHGLAFVIVVANLFGGIALALYLGRALLALDVSLLEPFASFHNPVYVLFVVALAAVVLEPVKVALGLLLLVDARVRSEGLDLRAAIDRLAARRKASSAVPALVVMAFMGGAPRPTRALDARTEQELTRLMDQTGVSDDRAALEGLEAARRLRGAEAVALRRFVDRARRTLDDGQSPEFVRRYLQDGLVEARAAERAAAHPVDPQAMARALLAQAEFEGPPDRQKNEDEQRPDSRLLRFLQRLFRDRTPAQPKKALPSHVPMAGLGAGTFRIGTYVLLALAVAGAVWVLARVLAGRPRADQKESDPSPSSSGAAEAELESALARDPGGWWSEADALAARGAYREALRALYLAVLSALHHRGAIEYEVSRSNGDYVRAFRGPGSELPAFRELTRRFDFAWYGRRGADALGYETARELAGLLVEQAKAHA